MLKCISCGEYYVPDFLMCRCQHMSGRLLLPSPFQRAQLKGTFDTALPAHGVLSEQSDALMQDKSPGSSSPLGRRDETAGPPAGSRG